MHSLDDALHEAMKRELELRLAGLLSTKLVAQGITFSDQQSEALLSAVRSGDPDAVKACFAHLEQDAVVDLSVQDDEVDAVADGLLAALPNLLEMSALFAGEMLSDLEATWGKQRRWEHRQRAGFDKRLTKQWADGLDSLEMMIVMAREFGSGLPSEADDGLRESRKFEVLLRLHARACQIATEVLTLLRAGLADGAMARWRSLHEVATVAIVLSEGDEDLAERYAQHDAIESEKAMREYFKYQDCLDVEPIDETELAPLRARRIELVEMYGDDYANPYGWACEVTKSRRPSFADIERAAGVDHLRAYYRMASHNVHANPKGVFFKLGLIGDSDILLAGASNAGLSDPGQSAAISLAQATAHFSLLIPSLDNLVVGQLMNLMVERVCDGFMRGHESLEGSA